MSFAKRILAKTPARSKLSVCSIGVGEKSERLFACPEDDPLGDGAMGEDEMIDNDAVAYSLVYMKPNQPLQDGAKLIDDVDRFVSERECF